MSDVASEHLPSVVGLVLNFRDAKRTFKCINSLLDEEVEHVLIWDNSEDNAQSANELRMMLQGNARVSIKISDRNLGFSMGVNRGREWIEANFPNRWILLINNDAVILPSAISRLMGALLQSPHAVISYPEIDHGDRNIGTVFYQRHFGLITACRLVGSIAYASGCCQLLASNRLNTYWFDEAFFMYGEDMELGYRVGEQRMILVPDVLVKHEGSASSGMGSIFYETRMVAAHWIIAPKISRGRLDLWILYMVRGFSLTLRSVFRAYRYQSWVPFKSLWNGMRLACRNKNISNESDRN